jgi:hypothetical protein
VAGGAYHASGNDGLTRRAAFWRRDKSSAPMAALRGRTCLKTPSDPVKKCAPKSQNRNPERLAVARP